MTIALWATLAVLAAAVFVLLGAQVEQFEQLKQLRRELALEEKSVPLEISAGGAVPSQMGLPPELDDADQALMVFLSDRCTTCYTIAGAFHGGDLPADTWLVILPVNDDGTEFLSRFQLYGERIIVDPGRSIAKAIGLEASPSALTIKDGRLVEANSVPSVRRLKEMFPTRAHRHRDADDQVPASRTS